MGKKNLVIVVHGIGEQSPGETIDNLVGGVAGDANVKVETSVRHFHAGKTGFGNHKIFPCHTNHLTGDDIDVVVGEVYWADLARKPEGFVRTILILLQTILAMANVIRENSAEVHGAGTWRSRIPSVSSILLVSVFASLNVQIALGWFFWWITDFGVVFLGQFHRSLTITDFTVHSGVFLSGVTGVVIGLYGSRRSTERLFRQFHIGIMIWGAIFAVFALGFGLADPAFDLKSSKFWFSVLQVFGTCLSTLGAGGDPPCDVYDWYALSAYFWLNAFWGVMMVGLAISIVSAWVKLGRQEGCQAPFYPAVMVAQLLLWMTILPTIWAVVAFLGSALVDDGGRAIGYLQQILNLLPVVWGCMLVLGAAAMAVLVERRRMRKSRPLDLQETMILHPVLDKVLLRIGWVLMTTSVLIALGRFSVVGEYLDWVEKILEFLFPVAFMVAFVAAAVFVWFWPKVSVALGIARDVTSYFVRSPHRAKGTSKVVPSGLYDWIADRFHYFCNPEADDWPEYPVREAVHKRFEIVFRQLSRAFPDHKITVLAHSQGTVIALKAMQEMVERSGKQENEAGESASASILGGCTLITMGSPFQSIFQKYFTSKFEIPEVLNDREKVPVWINIFRSDDFVGTMIDNKDGNWPKNRRVFPKGHTNYWTDPNVLAILKRYYDGPACSMRI